MTATLGNCTAGLCILPTKFLPLEKKTIIKIKVYTQEQKC